MATPQFVHGSPSHSFSPSHQHSSAPRMYDLPVELSSAQLEAKTILTHLLNRLKDSNSKYYTRYGKWLERHPRLDEFCFRCVRPQVWVFLQGRWSLDTLKAVGGDLKFEGRCVYLDGVLGLDKRVRIYIGQAVSLRQRVAQHLNFRYRRDNTSLHYHAMQHSIYNTFGTLAMVPSPNLGNHTLPGMDQPDLLLNVLEMWMCLVFRTLPVQTLDVWLNGVEGLDKGRKEGKEGEVGGLNIASPIDHGEKLRDWIDLSESTDPFILEYLGVGKEKEKDQDTPAHRKKMYTETARDNRHQEQKEIHVPPWVLFGGLAVAVGFILFNTSGGPQPRSRLRLG